MSENDSCTGGSERLEGVECFDFGIPVEEAYRRIQDSLAVASWVKTQSSHSFTIIGGGGHFTFDLVADGTHDCSVIYRSDLHYNERLIDTTISVLSRETNGLSPTDTDH